MTFPISDWRLILSPPTSGAWNMALDEAILEATGQGLVLPTLRLYAWDPPCLSLGYAQPFSDADQDQLRQRGWDLVRRPTGGRAILHTDELTYSVSAPHTEPRVAGSILESYQRLAQALLFALQSLSVPASTEEKYPISQEVDPKGAVCFEVPSNWEITVNGKKLIGSAQVRRKVGVLQHGTLPLHGDLTRITQVLSFPDQASRDNAAQRLLSRATTVELSLNKIIAWEQAANAMCEGFSKTLALHLISDEPTSWEIHRAEILMEEKYKNPVWNERI